MPEITLSPEEFKALSSNTRIQILKLLNQRNHTLTELSKKLNLSTPTIKQHLEVLVQSKIVELKDEGRKWKYYSLTRKGKNLLEPSSVNIMIVLIVLGIALTGLMLSILFQEPVFSTVAEGKTLKAVPEMKTEKPIKSLKPIISQELIALIIAIIVLSILIGFFIGKLERKGIS
jgi:DNA-binding transcriptional ArsR family regulator